MQQKLPKWTKFLKHVEMEPIQSFSTTVDFLMKAMVPFELVQKYWELEKYQVLLWWIFQTGNLSGKR